MLHGRLRHEWDFLPLSMDVCRRPIYPVLHGVAIPGCQRSRRETGGIDKLIFTGLTITFVKEFGVGLWVTFPLLLSLAAAITVLGQFVGRREGWSRFDSFYWSFVTATTVGYGDLRPVKRLSRIAAIVIAFLGLLLTGILIALAVRAGTVALGSRGTAG